MRRMNGRFKGVKVRSSNTAIVSVLRVSSECGCQM